MLIVFTIVPKNSGLQKYKKLAFSYLENSRIVEIRGEDIPFLVQKLQNKYKKVLGFVGEDLYKEYCLSQKNNLKILKRIIWEDSKALLKKPTLCLLGPKDKKLEDLPKKIRISIPFKYKKVVGEYLKKFYKKDYNFEKIYVRGCTELFYAEGVADLVIDIVYSGKSMEENNLKIYDEIMGSDFLIIGGKNEN